MLGIEIDLVVKDSIEALAIYEATFEVQRIEVGDFILGTNEVVLIINGTRFHLLDENEEYGLQAPKVSDSLPFWFNVVVADIESVYERATTNGFTTIHPINEMPGMGARNAMLQDPFGYVWVLHQIDREVSYEDRCKMFEAQGFERRK